MSLPGEFHSLKYSTHPNAFRSRAQSSSLTPLSHATSGPSTNSPASSIHPAFRIPPRIISDRIPRSSPHHPSSATSTSPLDTMSPLSNSRRTTLISPSLLHPALRTPSPATVSHALPIYNPSALRQSGRVRVVDIPAPLNVVQEVITPPLSLPRKKHFLPSASAAFTPAAPKRNTSAAILPSTIGVVNHQPPTTTTTTIAATGPNAFSLKVLKDSPGPKTPPPSIASPTRKYLHARTALKPPRPLKNCILESIRDTSRQLIASLTNGPWKKAALADEEAGLGSCNILREESDRKSTRLKSSHWE